MKSISEQLIVLYERVQELEERRELDINLINKYKQQASVLWGVAYEGLERDDDFYAVVEERTGQTRDQAEKYFVKKQHVAPTIGELKSRDCNLNEIQAALVALIELHNSTIGAINSMLHNGQIASKRDVIMAKQYGL